VPEELAPGIRQEVVSNGYGHAAEIMARLAAGDEKLASTEEAGKEKGNE
jgi:hypothetical protein